MKKYTKSLFTLLGVLIVGSYGLFSFSKPIPNVLLGTWTLTEVQSTETRLVLPAGEEQRAITDEMIPSPKQDGAMAEYITRVLGVSTFSFTEAEFEYVRAGKLSARGTWQMHDGFLWLNDAGKNKPLSYGIRLLNEKRMELNVNFDGHWATLIYVKQ